MVLNKRRSIYIWIILGLFLVIPFISYGQALPEILSEKCRVEGDCEVKEFFDVLIRGTQYMMAIVGAILLLTFMYGGFIMILSAGRSGEIDKAKRVFTGSVIGMVLVFGAYLIINVILQSLMLGALSGSDSVRSFTNYSAIETSIGSFQEAATIRGCCEWIPPGYVWACVDNINFAECESRSGQYVPSFYEGESCVQYEEGTEAGLSFAGFRCN